MFGSLQYPYHICRNRRQKVKCCFPAPADEIIIRIAKIDPAPAGDPAADDPAERASCRPDFFVPCYPVASFTQFPNIGSVNALLPDFDDMKLRRFFSAELNVTPDTPPAYIWHTSDDGSVPVENSLLLAGALSSHGVPFELHVYPDGPHGIGLAPEYPDARHWPEECLRFIKSVCG